MRADHIIWWTLGRRCPNWFRRRDVPLTVYLEHRRSTRAEAISTGLGALGAAGVVTIGFVWIALPFDHLALWLIVPIGLFFSYCVSLYCISNWHANGDFSFRIDDSAIVQVTPAPQCGESFTIPMSQVQHALYVPNTNSDDSHRWNLFIVDQDGKQFQVTWNYRNPVDRIVATLETLNVTVFTKTPSEQVLAASTRTKAS